MISVWGAQDQNPWLGLLFQAVSEGTGRPMPPPGLPTVFSLGSTEQFTAIVSSVLDEVTVEEHSVPLQARSFAEYWTRTTALAGPLSKILAELPQPVLDRIRGRLEELVSPFFCRRWIGNTGAHAPSRGTTPVAGT